jgi:hypothetical protein
MTYFGTHDENVELTIEKLRLFYASPANLFHKHGYWVNGVYTVNTSADEFAHEWQKRTKPLRNEDAPR